MLEVQLQQVSSSLRRSLQLFASSGPPRFAKSAFKEDTKSPGACRNQAVKAAYGAQDFRRFAQASSETTLGCTRLSSSSHKFSCAFGQASQYDHSYH